MAGKAIDYSFMYLGGLSDATFNVAVEACHRFGADKAVNVINTVMYMDPSASKPEVLAELKSEAGIEATAQDLEFLAGIIVAKQLVWNAIKSLEVACGK